MSGDAVVSHLILTSQNAFTYPFESTNRSRLNHFEFLGLAVKKLTSELGTVETYNAQITYRVNRT